VRPAPKKHAIKAIACPAQLRFFWLRQEFRF